MAPLFSLVFFLFSFVASAVDHRHHRGGESKSSSKDIAGDLSDALEKYNLPQGLFPTPSVTSFSLDEDDGSFRMKLDRSCYVNMEDELLWYGENIKGKMKPGRIEDLSGVQARELLVWLTVKGLHVDDPRSGYVYLEIGLTYTKLSAESFHEPPSCSTEQKDFV